MAYPLPPVLACCRAGQQHLIFMVT